MTPVTASTARVPGRVLAWTALLVALGASVLANVAYARPEIGPRLSAGTAPVLVVLAAGLLERVPLASARRWQRLLAAGGLVFVVAAAFITSYQHQSALLLAYGNPRLSAVLLPLAIDALIVMASVCLAVTAERRRASAPNIDQAVPTGPLAATDPDPVGAESTHDEPPNMADENPSDEPERDATANKTPAVPRTKPRTAGRPSAAAQVARIAARMRTPDADKIAAKTGLSPRTVKRHLDALGADNTQDRTPDETQPPADGADVPALADALTS